MSNAPTNGTNDNKTGEDGRQTTYNIPPSPPTVAKTNRPPMYRTGWSSAERIMSGSLRLSRASTRTSLASDDLDKYMTGSANNTVVGGSLNNVSATNNEAIAAAKEQPEFSSTPTVKPMPPPRISSSGSTTRITSAGGRGQEFMHGGVASASEVQAHATHSVATPSSSSSVPPPVKPRKSSSISSLNNPYNNVEPQTSNWFSNNHNLSENSKLNTIFNRKKT